MTKEKGFVILYEWLELLRELSGDEIKRLIFDLAEYEKNGIEPPEYTGSMKLVSHIIFSNIRERKKVTDVRRKCANVRWSANLEDENNEYKQGYNAESHAKHKLSNAKHKLSNAKHMQTEKEREEEREKEKQKEKVIQKEKEKEKGKEEEKEKESRKTTKEKISSDGGDMICVPHSSEHSRESHEDVCIANKYTNCFEEDAVGEDIGIFTDAGEERKKKERKKDAKSQDRELISAVVDRLNKKAGTCFRSDSKTTVSYINARLGEGYVKEDFFAVIDVKCSEWLGSDKECYLRPMTLFSNKFESYLNQAKKTLPAYIRNDQNNKYNDDIDDFFYEG